MTAPFDPYHRWLGIRPEEQPADHYRLLGLARYEDDVEVIRDAAERQMAHVRRYAVGEHVDNAKRILNELGNAKACLIVQDKKVSYDATLKGTVAATTRVHHSTDTSQGGRPQTRQSAPTTRELVEFDSEEFAPPLELDEPVPPVPQPETTARRTAPTPPRQPKTLAQTQVLRQRRLSTVPSVRQLAPQADGFLKWIAGDGNELLHGFLRVLVPAASVIIVSICVLWTGSWAMQWSRSTPEIAMPPKPPSTPPSTQPPITPPLLILVDSGERQVMQGAELRREIELTEGVRESCRFEFVGESYGAELTPRGVFTWTPSPAHQPGLFRFQIRAVSASEGATGIGPSEPLAFNVAVLKRNQPPRFEAIPDQEATLGEVFTLSFKAFDPDLPDDVLMFRAVTKPPNSYLDPATGDFQWTPSSTSAAGIALAVRVTDKADQSDNIILRIRVKPKPATVVEAGPKSIVGTRALPLPAQIENSVGMRLVLIPAGEFLMGSPPTEAGRDNDEQQHLVRITQPFYMATTEVTQGQWEAVMKTTPWKRQLSVMERSDCPATYVTWENAVEFCRRLSATESRTYRLPTEAEWEYACRAGSTTIYSFGDCATSLKDYAWFSENAWNVKYAHRVGQKLPNSWGLYDMMGNVWEWTADLHGNYQSGEATDPTGAAGGSLRVFRGGSFRDVSSFCRVAFRSRLSSGFQSSLHGFRLALVQGTDK